MTSKWKNDKYSRNQRKKRRFENNFDIYQPPITNSFPILNQIEKILDEQQHLRNEIKALRFDSKNENDETTDMTFFNELYKFSKQNIGKMKRGVRHEDDIKNFSAYLYATGGRKLYETLSMNLPLPSRRTVLNIIHTDCPAINEGEILANELKQFLMDRNLGVEVWISEDATRITGKFSTNFLNFY